MAARSVSSMGLCRLRHVVICRVVTAVDRTEPEVGRASVLSVARGQDCQGQSSLSITSMKLCREYVVLGRKCRTYVLFQSFLSVLGCRAPALRDLTDLADAHDASTQANMRVSTCAMKCCVFTCSLPNWRQIPTSPARRCILPHISGWGRIGGTRHDGEGIGTYRAAHSARGRR